MIRVIPVKLTIAAAGTSHESDAILNSESFRLIAWEFTTPDYNVARTSAVSIISPGGRTLITGSAINEATASVKICTDSESVPLFSGFKVHVTTADAVGVEATFSILLYVTDQGNFVNVPTAFVHAMSFGHQMATIDQAAPAQNTWYTVVNTTEFIKLFGIGVFIADTGETIEVRVTVDGSVITGSGALNADTNYKALINTLSTGHSITLSSSSLLTANQLEARSMKVEVRKTSVAGGGNLKACVAYCQRG